MVRTQVYLSEETKEALTRLAEEKGTSQSALIREALDSFFEAGGASSEEERLDDSFGIWKDRENVHEEFREIRESLDREVWERAMV
jgi:hypothetical protein